jgi:flagellar motor switch protein FliN
MKSFAELSNFPKASAFLNAWVEAFAAILEKAAGRKHPVELVTVESTDPVALAEAEKGVSLVFTAGGTLQGEHACLVSEPDSKLLAQLLAAGGSDADQVFRQVAAHVAIDLTAKWSGPVSLAFDAARPPAWEPAAKAAIRITTGDAKQSVVIFTLQDTLLAALTESPDAAKSPAPPQESGKTDPAPAAKNATNSNLDLLLDIELEATIRFGQREMLLGDILELHAGSVVELERHVEEPAELLVAGRAVARGEVVVVEGNYGLRITEILSPRQRYEVVGK